MNDDIKKSNNNPTNKKQKMSSYYSSISSDDYCTNQKDCRKPESVKLDYTITTCPGTSNPACRQLNITGQIPPSMAYNPFKKEGEIHVSLPQMPGCIYKNEAWGKIESCDTTANMRGRAHKHLDPNGDLVFTVNGPGHTCAPSINASVNFLAPHCGYNSTIL